MTIKEVCEKYGISADTLRYYEKVGVVPPVTRTNGGFRFYTEKDIEWVENAICMRNAGLSVEMLSEYVRLFQEGDSTIPARLSLLIEANETNDMIAYAWGLGINFIDTANFYGGGTSEEYTGRALKNIGIPRDKVILASKVYFNEGKLSRNAILREIDGTLSRLGTDYLDLYLIHRFDYDTPIEETMEALDSLVKSGKVCALGVSAMYGYQFHNMQVCAEQNGWTKFSTMQNHYNILHREDERELIPICKQYNVFLNSI